MRPSTSAKRFKKVAKALVNCPQALDFVDISLRFDPELVKVRGGEISLGSWLTAVENQTPSFEMT